MSSSTTPHPVLPVLRNGLLAGGLAGLVSGLFSLLLAEPLMDRAIELEEKRAATAGGTGHHSHGATPSPAEAEELFSRGTQHTGLLVTAVIVGLAVGVFFALAQLLVHRGSVTTHRPWERALTMAGAGFLALSFLPALRYPANPPGVGDSGTVAGRQSMWLAALLIGMLGMLLARQLHTRLARAGHGAPARQSAVAGAVVATLAAMFLLPGNPDPVPVPPGLLWDFRLLSLASHALMWATLGAAFGALALRETGPSRAAEPATAAP